LLPLIFERFRQGDSSSAREHGGLGLGLAIVRHLVELHGGVVTARSQGEGKGSEFAVEIPISVAPSAVLENESRVGRGAGGATLTPMPSLEGLRILVVDDDADAREVVSTILSQAGAEVATAASAPQALDLVERWVPNVLISDIGMPGEDGYQLIRKLRTRFADKSNQIPAIALTAFARSQDRLKALSAGYQTHVAKPIEPLELVTVIASLTQRL
jgi:CheY-like chemotaxis protein